MKLPNSYDLKERLPLPKVDFTVTFEEFLSYHRLAPHHYTCYANGVTHREPGDRVTRYIGFVRTRDLCRYHHWLKQRRKEHRRQERESKRLDSEQAKLDFLDQVVGKDIAEERERADDYYKEAQNIFEQIKHANKLRKSLRVRKK